MPFRISDFLKKDFCLLDLKASTREGALKEIIALLAKSAKLKDPNRLLADILEREKHSHSGFGRKTIIAHSPSDSAEELIVSFGRSKHGIEVNPTDGERANLIFVVTANPCDLHVYLTILGSLSRLLHEEFFRKELINAETPSEVINIVKRFEVR